MVKTSEGHVSWCDKPIGTRDYYQHRNIHRMLGNTLKGKLYFDTTALLFIYRWGICRSAIKKTTRLAVAVTRRSRI